MMVFVSSCLLLLAVALEATNIPIPLTLLGIVMLGVFQKKEWVFFFAIIAGILLDSLTFRPLGLSALFFLITAGLLFLYQKKFETNHMLFGTVFTAISCTVYLLLFRSEPFILGFLGIVGLAVAAFGLPFLLGTLSKKTKKDFIL